MTRRGTRVWLLAVIGLAACASAPRGPDASALFAAGLAEERAGRDLDALDAYRAAVRAEPAFLDAHVARQDLAVRRGDRALLIPEYASLRTGRPRLDVYLRARLETEPDRSAALEDLADGQDDVAAAAAVDLALIRLQGDRAGPGLDAAMTAVFLRPDFGRAHLARALALEALGRDAEALVAFEAARSLGAWSAETEAGRARLLLRAGRRDEAEAALASVPVPEARGVAYQLARADVAAAFGRPEEVVRALETAMRDAPRDPGPRRRLGLLLCRPGGDPVRAWFLLAPLAGPESRDVEVLIAGGELDLAGDRAEEAIRKLERAVRLGAGVEVGRLLLEAKLAAGRLDEVRDADAEGDPARLVVRARAWQRLGRAKKAREDLREALRLDPAREDAAADLALLLADEGRFDEAFEVLRDRPDSPRVAAARGRVLLLRGDPDGAETALRKALASGAGGSSVHLDLAEVMRRQHRTAERIRWLRAGLAADPGDPALTLALARAVGTTPEAEAIVRGLLRRTPPPPGARPVLVRLLLARGAVAEAIRTAIRASEERPDDPPARAALGDAYAAAGRPDEAERAYEEALTRDPRCPDALLGRARLLARLGPGRARDAAAAYGAALDADPWSAAARRGLARIQRDLGEDGRMIETLAPLVEGAEPDAEALDLTAAAQTRQGELEAATEALRRLLPLRPRDPDVHLRLGIVYRQRGRRAEAELYLRRALRLGADPETVRKLLTE